MARSFLPFQNIFNDMSNQLTVKDVFGAIKIGYYSDGFPTIDEDLEQAIVPGENYSKLLAEELPSQTPLARAIILFTFARAKHIEALPHALTLLENADGLTHFLAALAAAALHDSRGTSALRRHIAEPDPEMSRAHIVEDLEEAVASSSNPELRELLDEAKTAFGFK